MSTFVLTNTPFPQSGLWYHEHWHSHFPDKGTEAHTEGLTTVSTVPQLVAQPGSEPVCSGSQTSAHRVLSNTGNYSEEGTGCNAAGRFAEAEFSWESARRHLLATQHWSNIHGKRIINTSIHLPRAIWALLLIQKVVPVRALIFSKEKCCRKLKIFSVLPLCMWEKGDLDQVKELLAGTSILYLIILG